MGTDATPKQRGFTLIEAMVAAVVLATGLLSVLSLFAYSLSNLQLSQEDLIARAKAKEGWKAFSARAIHRRLPLTRLITRPMAAYFWMVFPVFTIRPELMALRILTMTAPAPVPSWMLSCSLDRMAYGNGG